MQTRTKKIYDGNGLRLSALWKKVKISIRVARADAFNEIIRSHSNIISIMNGEIDLVSWFEIKNYNFFFSLFTLVMQPLVDNGARHDFHTECLYWSWNVISYAKECQTQKDNDVLLSNECYAALNHRISKFHRILTK